MSDWAIMLWIRLAVAALLAAGFHYLAKLDWGWAALIGVFLAFGGMFIMIFSED